MFYRTKTASVIKHITAASILALSLPAIADHKLDQEASSLHFMSTKNEHITEQHTFENFTGSLSDNGEINIEIDLSSVETIIPIRNERMRKMLFDVANYPSATFSATIDPELKNLRAGERKTVTVAGKLTIKEVSQNVTAELNLVGLQNEGLKASTTKPIVLDARSLGLEDGVTALREIAMLKKYFTYCARDLYSGI